MKDYVVRWTQSGWHRDTTYRNLVDFDRMFYIDDIPVVIATLDTDSKWWIIPDNRDDEDIFQDMGPYETFEDAIVFMKLQGVPK